MEWWSHSSTKLAMLTRMAQIVCAAKNFFSIAPSFIAYCRKKSSSGDKHFHVLVCKSFTVTDLFLYSYSFIYFPSLLHKLLSTEVQRAGLVSAVYHVAFAPRPFPADVAQPLSGWIRRLETWLLWLLSDFLGAVLSLLSVSCPFILYLSRFFQFGEVDLCWTTGVLFHSPTFAYTKMSPPFRGSRYSHANDAGFCILLAESCILVFVKHLLGVLFLSSILFFS